MGLSAFFPGMIGQNVLSSIRQFSPVIDVPSINFQGFQKEIINFGQPGNTSILPTLPTVSQIFGSSLNNTGLNNSAGLANFSSAFSVFGRSILDNPASGLTGEELTRPAPPIPQSITIPDPFITSGGPFSRLSNFTGGLNLGGSIFPSTSSLFSPISSQGDGLVGQILDPIRRTSTGSPFFSDLRKQLITDFNVSIPPGPPLSERKSLRQKIDEALTAAGTDKAKTPAAETPKAEASKPDTAKTEVKKTTTDRAELKTVIDKTQTTLSKELNPILEKAAKSDGDDRQKAIGEAREVVSKDLKKQGFDVKASGNDNLVVNGKDFDIISFSGGKAKIQADG